MPAPSPRPRVWSLRLAAALGGLALLGAARPLFRAGMRVAHPQQPANEAPEAEEYGAAHETEDMDGRTLTKLVAGLGFTVACVICLMILVLAVMLHGRTASQPTFTTQQVAPIVPPTPHLQANPMAELGALRAKEDTALDGYGWTGPSHDRARIPIDRAMDLTIGHTLAPPP